MATCHVRSVSWPSSSHPLIVSVEDQLDKLRSSQTPSTSVYQKARGLRVLYECVDDFLRLPLTQQTLSKERAEEVLNGSLLLLDVCSNTKDVFSSMKECFKRLESSLRRRKGYESGIASEIEAYVVSRKQLNKTTHKCFRNLKSMEKNNTSAVDAVGMLRDVKEITLEILQCLVFGFSAKDNIKLPWLVCRFKIISIQACIMRRQSHRIGKIDAELLVLKSGKNINPIQVQNILKELELLESSIYEADEELEAVYRKFLKTRVSILNILSHLLMFFSRCGSFAFIVLTTIL